MKLSKLYTNCPKIFEPIEFEPGLNVVLAEIRLPENRQKDVHNLGKTTLGELINFTLLSRRDPKFFLFEHFDRFKQFVFFLEIELLDRTFVTVRRSVEAPTRMAFKTHDRYRMDFTKLGETEWDHTNVAFDKAKVLLDGLLDLQDLKPWPVRKVVGYLTRSQADFTQVFHLKQFASGHADWKPFLAHIMGFDGGVVEKHYAKEAELDCKKVDEAVIERELGGSISDLSKIEGMLQLKRADVRKRQALLDAFDFRNADRRQTKLVVDELDEKLADLNTQRYSLTQTKKKLTKALAEDEILFDTAQAETIFADAGIHFAGQLKKDFDQLISFNREITEERAVYLSEELTEVDEGLRTIGKEITRIGKRRADSLSFLSEEDIFTKYRAVGDELVELRADVTSLERQREFLAKLKKLRAVIRELSDERKELQTQVEANVEHENANSEGRFSELRGHFSEFVETVISRQALLSVSPNNQGHLEFESPILDEMGKSTSADKGTTYRKLLCVAFDLALTRTHLTGRYPRFVFHDGVLEPLEDRKKLNLIEVLREYSSLGIQQIITVIDSDIPPIPKEDGMVFEDAEIVLRLHDEGNDGQLFKMEPW